MTLSTRPEEIYRALLEATAYGARIILDTYREYGIEIQELYAAGGIPAKNDLIMQIYADVLNLPVKVAVCPPSSALGSAVFASVASGYFDSIELAAARLSGAETICYHPNQERVAQHEKIFEIYKELHDYFGVKNVEIMQRLNMD